MKKFTLLTKLLAVIAAISMLAACGGKGEDNSNNSAAVEQTEFTAFPEKLNAEKIGSFKLDGEKSMTVTDGGIYYETEDGKYGVATLDGKKDTGAVYAYCKQVGNFFAVVKELPEGNDIASMNCFAIIDATGKEIIPAGYAAADAVSDKYIRVCEATEETDSKDDALIYGTDNVISLLPDADDSLYKGNWYIYDTETCQKVEGVTGTKGYPVTARGEYISFTTDNGERMNVNSKGQAAPEGANIFVNGCYAVEVDKTGNAYDSKNNLLFTYNTEEFKPYSADLESGLFIASKYVDGSTKYALMDDKGELVSAEFDKTPAVYGNFILVEDKLYDFEGNVVLEENAKTIHTDVLTKKAYMIKTSDDKAIVIDEDANILYESESSGDYIVDSTYFTAGKKSGSVNKYYSLKDKDYTIEGSSLAPWVVRAASGDEQVLVDTISGETIVKGYKTYSYTDAAGKACYIYAKKDAGQYDIYIIK